MKKYIRNLLMVMLIALVMAKSTAVQASDVTDMKMGTKYSANLSKDTNPDDWYKFSLSKSGLVTFKYETSGTYHAKMYLYNANKQQIDTNSCSDKIGSNGFRLNAGTYYLKMALLTANATSYSFTPYYSDANETFSYDNQFISDVKSKSAIPFSTWIHGQIAVTEQNDYYKVVVPKAGKIKVDVSNGAYSIDVEVYNKSERRLKHMFILSNRKDSATIKVPKGTYYIKFSRTSGAYKFKVTATSSPLASMTVKKASATSMVVKANKAGAVSGYEIRYKKSSGSWKKFRVSGSKKLNKKIKKLKKGGTYTVQIRTYYTYKGTKIYSDWSSKRKVKLK